MLERPLIIGSRGVMGRRYGAIFKYLGIKHLGMDIGDAVPTGFDSVLIATPTVKHIRDIQNALDYDVPILCEKPIATDLDEVLQICDEIELAAGQVRMVNQYEYLQNPSYKGATVYNYFNHGKDGLAWDCISLIALAQGEIVLGEDSPIWHAFLNGARLSLGDMDRAYIDMISDWVGGYVADLAYIREAHLKVHGYIEERK